MQSEQNRTDKRIKKWQPQTTEKLSERSFLDNINSVDDKLINHVSLTTWRKQVAPESLTKSRQISMRDFQCCGTIRFVSIRSMKNI